MRLEDGDERTAILDAVLAIAGETRATAAQVSMAWLRHHAAHSGTAFIPVIGPRTTTQLDDYLAALELDLTTEQYDRLQTISAVALGTPHETAAAALPGALGGDARLVHRHPVPVI